MIDARRERLEKIGKWVEFLKIKSVADLAVITAALWVGAHLFAVGFAVSAIAFSVVGTIKAVED